MRPELIDEQIPRMHVGVEKSVAQGVTQERLDHLLAKLRQVETFGAQCIMIGEMRALDPFECQHVFGRAQPVDGRNAEIRIVFGVLRHFRQGGGFEPQIHFERDRAAQRLGSLDHAQTLRLGGEFFRLTRHINKSILIGLETALDPRP